MTSVPGIPDFRPDGLLQSQGFRQWHYCSFSQTKERSRIFPSTSQLAGRQGGKSRGMALPSRGGTHKHHSRFHPVGQKLVPWPHPGACFYFGQEYALLLTRDSISVSEKGRVGIWGHLATSATLPVQVRLASYASRAS